MLEHPPFDAAVLVFLSLCSPSSLLTLCVISTCLISSVETASFCKHSVSSTSLLPVFVILYFKSKQEEVRALFF